MDPDTLIAADTATDHFRAHARGQRVRDLANLIVSALDAHGVLRDEQKARVICNGVLCEALYGNAAVDLDPRR